MFQSRFLLWIFTALLFFHSYAVLAQRITATEKNKVVVPSYNPEKLIQVNQILQKLTSFQGFKVLYINLNHIPNANQKQFWSESGIQFLEQKNEKQHLIAIPENWTAQQFSALEIPSFEFRKTEEKLSVFLSSKINNLGENQQITIGILPFKAFKNTKWSTIWNSDWGILKEIWDGDVPRLLVSTTGSKFNFLLEQPWIRSIDIENEEIIPLNQVASANGRIRFSAGFSDFFSSGLDGSGVSVAVGDGGLVDLHADLESHQVNFTGAKLPSFGNHQDHVSGTLAGGGLLQKDKMGMAPGTRLVNLQTSAAIANGVWLSQKENIHLTNNSFGQTLQCDRAGLYNATSAFIDEQCTQVPTLLHVVAAGNQGGSGCNNFPTGFQTIAEGYPVAKNALTVGSVLAKDEFAWFSSMGPVQDGRIKPEIVSDGNDLQSTVPQDQYAAKGGTSMATPVVSGLIALLTQRFKELNNGAQPEAALLKGIVCNSADDVGRPNVDFSTGFGRINGRKARKVIENQTFYGRTIQPGELITIPLVAPSQAQSVKIMLSWTDPAAALSSTKMLVNNLDLQVKNAAGQPFLPWVLVPTPSGVYQNAIRGLDTLNNLEQISLPVFGGESIQIEIKAGALISAQKCWVVVVWEQPEIVLTSPVRGEEIKSNQNFTFRWDFSSLQINTLDLETSSDSLQWNTWQTNLQPQILAGDFVLPNTSFQTIWYRLKVQTDLGTMYSNAVVCRVGKTPSITYTPCANALKMSWSAQPDADYYEILKLDFKKGKWEKQGLSYSPETIIGGLENGRRYSFTIQPIFGGTPGIISQAKVILVTGSGTCPWNDIALKPTTNATFFRQFTSQAPPEGNQMIKVILANVGSTQISNQTLLVKCRLPDGQILQKDLNSLPSSGDSLEVVFNQGFTLNTPGEYPFTCWIANNPDNNRWNDTIKWAVRVVDNPLRALPQNVNFENGNFESLVNSESGLLSGDFVDFISTNGGRMRTSMVGLPPDWGNRSLILDKEKVDGKTAEASAIMTLNLSENILVNALTLHFQMIPFGQPGPGNGLWIRANDQQAWKQVLDFSNENLQIGQLNYFESINLSNHLDTNVLGTSFQIRFTFSGQRPADILNPQGYAIDQILLLNPTKDVIVKQILSPASRCGGSGNERVKIRLWNESPVNAQNVQVGYSLHGIQYQKTINLVQGLDSLDVEFEDNILPQITGNLDLKVWAKTVTDNNSLNDTIQSEGIFWAPVIQKLPYHQGFENSAGDWRSYGKNNSWEWGKPSRQMEILDTAANGEKVWATNLSGNYKADEYSFLQSPCFNVSNLNGQLQCSFFGRFDTEPNYDFFWLELSTDGKSWKKFGQIGKGTNGYNHPSDSWCGKRSRWQTMSIPINLDSLPNKNTLQFRFVFSSDLSNQGEGITLDDIYIEPTIEIGKNIKPSGEKISVNILEDNWKRLGIGNGRLAEIQTEQAVPVFDCRENEGRTREFGYTPYLDRNFVLYGSDSLTESATIRLFFTEQEALSLEANDPNIRSVQQLGIFQYRGVSADFEPENNNYVFGEKHFLSAKSLKKIPTSGGYYLEFEAIPDGEFYITNRNFDFGDQPLPVELLRFSAKRKNSNKVEIRWETGSETNCERFDLFFSANGKDFNKLQSFMPQGQGKGFQYLALHSLPQSETGWYRLEQFDRGNEFPKTFHTIIKSDFSIIKDWQCTNPFSTRIEISGELDNDWQAQLLDVSGKIIWNGSVEILRKINTNNWPDGIFMLQVASPEMVWTKRLIKTM